MSEQGRHLVLIGGGHAHVFVLRAFGLNPLAGVSLTLIAKELDAPYSGMLPGFVAGHYSLEECQIDLRPLARFAGARLVHGSAAAIDRERREVAVAGHSPVPYDVLSIDVGITPDLSGIAGAETHALAVKPVSLFAPKWQHLLSAAHRIDGPRRIVAVGGGAAGVELILAAREALTRRSVTGQHGEAPFEFSLLTSGGVLPSHNRRAQILARTHLQRAGVTVVEGESVVEIGSDHVRLRSGRVLPCDAAIVSTRAKAPSWFAGTGLQRDAGGYLAVRPTLQTYTDPSICAAGDCAAVIEHPREKAGVFAVRQGPVLAENLRRILTQAAPPQPFVPQRKFLTLVSLGDKRAIASRGRIAVSGRWAWVWKDWIDRRFMTMFKSLVPPRQSD